MLNKEQRIIRSCESALVNQAPRPIVRKAFMVVELIMSIGRMCGLTGTVGLPIPYNTTCHFLA